MDKTAILGTFTKIDSVATRKIARLYIEIPIEGVDNALDILGGYPDGSAPVHVAIARIKTDTVSGLKTGLKTGEEEGMPDSEKHYRKSWGELAYVTRAGIRSNDKRFQSWIGVENQEQAAEWLRSVLVVKTRTEILPGTAAAEKFEQIDGDFRNWLREEEEGP